MRGGIIVVLFALGVSTVEEARGQTPAPNLAAVVTASEMDNVRNRLVPCVGAEMKNLPQNVVRTRVELDRSGSVVQVELVDPRYQTDPALRSYGDAVKRVLLNPRCQQWPLSPEKYQSWKRITFNFDWRDYAVSGQAPPLQRAPTSGDPRARGTVDKWEDANSKCRGGRPGDPQMDNACAERTVLTVVLEAQGYCRGKEGEPAHMAAWHQCGPSSLKSDNADPPYQRDVAEQPATQQLPGPASDGWYVIMGPIRGGKGQNIVPGAGGLALDALANQQRKQMGYSCVGGVVPAKDRLLVAFQYQMMFEVTITKRFGPYTQLGEAAEALRRAGWQPVKDGFWTSSGGCE